VVALLQHKDAAGAPVRAQLPDAGQAAELRFDGKEEGTIAATAGYAEPHAAGKLVLDQATRRRHGILLPSR
jgi:hypothetical protein